MNIYIDYIQPHISPIQYHIIIQIILIIMS